MSALQLKSVSLSASTPPADPWYSQGIDELGPTHVAIVRRGASLLLYAALPVIVVAVLDENAARDTYFAFGRGLKSICPPGVYDSLAAIIGPISQFSLEHLSATFRGLLAIWILLFAGLVPTLAASASLYAQTQEVRDKFNRNVARDADEARRELDEATELKNARVRWRIWQFARALAGFQVFVILFALGHFAAALFALLCGFVAIACVMRTRSLDSTWLAKKYLAQMFEERDRSLPNGMRQSDVQLAQIYELLQNSLRNRQSS